ncbi:D-aminoacid aminotransferase-like PLP-dependent enzyme [Gonapodya prolifera JEL478]|uniref:D-aminoacid aminotransferase-like PLP-dependent enzyme n=1 Tax=Gonapodya prolifera (strain JEL478) TaxID=1344416 RepID=A0A139AJT9_GONPJ|nr:D-aminoacid aminotransferase-like PLP-dependent enzyme [Gonapodya prolifera JEL478]|eukprot:KXS17031.1 D-aminoacid aminotransferase-like PLP-dependent enzyme [Gonapodya prolifera JEL478]
MLGKQVANAIASLSADALRVMTLELAHGNTIVEVHEGIQLAKPVDIAQLKAIPGIAEIIANATVKESHLAIGSDVISWQTPPVENKFAKGAAYLSGVGYVPISEAKISVTDYGYRRSDATYDVVSVWDGNFFRLDDHIARFRRSMDGLRMHPPESNDDIKRILHEILRLSGLKNAYVAMDCLRGVPPPGAPRRTDFCAQYIICYCIPYAWLIAKDIQETRGAYIVTSKVPRIPDECVDPTIKNFHWGDLTKASFAAYDQGADTAILLDQKGNLTEGPGFNICLIHTSSTPIRVVTPERGCLLGVTRQSVIELCEDMGFECEVRAVPKEEMERADEVFICTTAGGIMPISKVDGVDKCGGKPGPVTMAMRTRYWEKRAEGWHAEQISY